jgi:quercetin dioxygenase-like cupin family protein
MNFSERFCSLLVVFVASVMGLARLAAQETEEKPIVTAAATAKFGAIPNAPDCFTVAVERGDPTKGPSVILARFAPGCVAPFHWHTPSETAMVVSGSLEATMKGDKPFVAHHGDFLYLPAHHVHRATCLGSAPCLVFLTSDAAFDIHWVDAAGQEIPLETALKNIKPAKTPQPVKQ